METIIIIISSTIGSFIGASIMSAITNRKISKMLQETNKKLAEIR